MIVGLTYIKLSKETRQTAGMLFPLKIIAAVGCHLRPLQMEVKVPSSHDKLPR